MSGRGNRGGGRGGRDGGGGGGRGRDGGGRGRDGGGRGRGNRDHGGGGGYGGGRDGGGGGGGRGRGRNMASSSGGYVSTIPPSTREMNVSLPSTPSLSADFQRKVAVGSSSSSAPVHSPAPPAAALPAVQSAMQEPQPVPVKTEQPAATVTTKALMPPMRPQVGTVGRKCIVSANHFFVEVSNSSDLHHYDVTITPEVTSKRVCREILSKLVELYRDSHMAMRRLAYDGKKSAFTQGALPFESKEFVVKLDEKDDGRRREREFKVTIRFAAKPDIEHLRLFLQRREHDVSQETIQALDVVLRATPSIKHEVVGRAFFSQDFGAGPLGDGLDFWKGFYQSLRPTQMGLSLNVDTSARAFYEPILVSDFVAKNLRKDISRPLSDQDRVKIKKVLKGVRVETRHTKYIKSQKIAGLSTQPLNALTFSDATGSKLSVAQYFRTKYNIALKFPLLPAIQVGTDARPTYLPMEICRIKEGQRYTRKLNERQVTSMLNATCKTPNIRESEIQKMVNCNNYNQDELAHEEFGIQVRPTMVSIEARVLPPPPLKYHETGKESLVNPYVGQWNMINKKMIDGGTVNVWACVNFSRSKNEMVNNFCYELGSMCASKGMAFNPQPVIPLRSYHPGMIEKALHEIHEQVAQQLDLLIVILPDQTGQYGTIKRVCETELGIVSQCCQPRNVPRCSKQYLENVSLKINVKVGGRNTVLLQAIQRKIPYLSDCPTIIFGADVTHPQPGEDSSSSIAALVASMDWPEVSKYRGLFSPQPHRQEIIQDLYHTRTDPVKGIVHGGMFRDHLVEFYKVNHLKPGRIIFYRDGVSEGQFSQVLSGEMYQIRKACESLDATYRPRITFVVVQKRHHTRLFPANYNDKSLTDKSGNILPGTVVDTKICHPTEFDFYLCSHAGIKGTSRPTHYHVLFDSNGFTADGLQNLTNSLCYTYARCTRSVSVVPPAYYAHLLAFRARYYCEGDISETDSSGRGGAATRDQPAAVRALPRLKDNVKRVMFFC